MCVMLVSNSQSLVGRLFLQVSLPSVCFPMLIMGINDMANGTFTVSELVLRGPEMGVC